MASKSPKNASVRSAKPVVKPWEHAKGGKSGSGGDPLASRFVESLSYDRRLYKHDIAGSIAHATMLEKVGLITKQELSEIKRGLKEIEKEIEAAGADYGASWPGWKIELEDVHMCIEAALIEKVGDAGRKLHTGRSRNDQVALDLLLWVREESEHLRERIVDLLKALVALADKQGGIVMPAYTHLQRAQPIVAGAELMAWARAFGVCIQRIESLRVLDRSPLGSGAIAGSSLPLDRMAVAGELLDQNIPGDIANLLSNALGLSDAMAKSIDMTTTVEENSIFATASRDAALDFIYCLTTIANWLSRWAEQWIIYCSTEFSFITLDAKYTTGSSMMPQKRNPDMLELIRGRCGNVYGHLVALLTILKGIPVGYNRDLQEDKRHVFAAYDVVSDCLEMAARIVATTKFNEEKIKATLDRGFLDATSLAEYLVTRGVPFRTAHQVVGSLVRTCEERGLVQLSQLAVKDFETACDTAGAKKGTINRDVYDWLGAENVVKRYQTYGNAGVSGFHAQLKTWKERIKGGMR